MNRKTKTNVLRIVTLSMFVALYVVLSFFASVRIPPLIKISWASLPLLVTAFLFTPVDAVLVAFAGAFLEQLLSYGISVTTPLWILPAVLHAAFVSMLAPLCRCKKGRHVREAVLVFVSEFFLTALNTAALYLDGFIVGYAVGALTAILPVRLLNGSDRAVLSAVLVPVLLPPLRKAARACGLTREKASADAESISYIHSHPHVNGRRDLTHMRTLLHLLGDPQNDLRFVHVAGTNGKGSVCAMTASVLQAAGYKTGLFVSPYIRTFRERIQVNGSPIPAVALARLTKQVRPYVDLLDEASGEFEIVTAIGFLYFKECGCDVVVLETGLGGRLDPTNVIKEPLLSVITGISLDHMSVLGDTIEKIAAEKAGIIKPGCPVLYGGQNADALSVIRTHAVEQKCTFHTANEIPLRVDREDLLGVTVTTDKYTGIHVPLAGIYQPQNIRCVLAALEILKSEGLAIPADAVRRGLSDVRWPARFEILSRRPLVIFDGAHNPEGAGAAADSLRTYFPSRKFVFLVGVMADKEYGKMADILAPLANRVFTVTADNPRALAAEKLAAEFECRGASATPCANIGIAVKEAKTLSKKTNCPLVCLGSLYMYGPVSDEFGK